MNIAQVIARKRDGHALSTEEIEFFIQGFQAGRIEKYQMSAMAMAIYIRGMDARETADLTHQMLHSGKVLQWRQDATYVDKHSTGGVGDKVSLILAPVLACCGLKVPMLSGRGLGPTGGTLDKLEAIPGFEPRMTVERMQQIADEVGCVIAAASDELAPVDRELYKLRDVTATVASIPLITASIMSKKLAEGLDALVLDVKYGSGAFMKSQAAASELAESLVRTGEQLSLQTAAMITDMNQPLGKMVGNAVEVDESLDVLGGDGPADLRELTCRLAARLLTMTGRADHSDDAFRQAERQLSNGAALAKFREMVAAQGGNLDIERPIAEAWPVVFPRGGYVQSMDAEALGYVLIAMGGGREVATDEVDPSVGLEMHVRVGDRVDANQPAVTVFADPSHRAAVEDAVLKSIVIGDQPVAPLSLVVAGET